MSSLLFLFLNMLTQSCQITDIESYIKRIIKSIITYVEAKVI